MRCDAIADDLAGAMDDATVLDDSVAAHVATCLRCQVEMVQYRRLGRTLRSLRSVSATPADNFLDDLVAVIDDPDLYRGSSRANRRTAYLSGLAAATAAGAAGALVIASRARGRRLVG